MRAGILDVIMSGSAALKSLTVKPWYESFGKDAFNAARKSGDRFVIADHTGAALERMRTFDSLLDPTQDDCEGWTLLKQDVSLFDFALAHLDFNKERYADRTTLVAAAIFDIIGTSLRARHQSNMVFAAELLELDTDAVLRHVPAICAHCEFAWITNMAETEVAAQVIVDERYIRFLLDQLASFLNLLPDGNFTIEGWFKETAINGSALFLTSPPHTQNSFSWLIDFWFTQAVCAYDKDVFADHGKVWFIKDGKKINCAPSQRTRSAYRAVTPLPPKLSVVP